MKRTEVLNANSKVPGVPYPSLSGYRGSLASGPSQRLPNQSTMFKERHRESGKRQLKVVKMVNKRNLLGRAIPKGPFLSASGGNLVFPSLKIQSLGEKAVKTRLDLEKRFSSLQVNTNYSS